MSIFKLKNKNKKHLVLVTYDGVATHYSGVGTIAKNMINSLKDYIKLDNLRVSIAYVNVDKESKVFNAICFNDSKKVVEKTGGALAPLYNGKKGESEWDMWGGFDEWKLECSSLVAILNTILNSEEDNFIVLNDTPFLTFAKYKDFVNDKKLKYFYFPLSTGKNHNFGDDIWRNNRIKLEQECFDLIKTDHNSRVIALGKKFAERMTEDYGLSFSKHDFLQNGLCFEKYKEFTNKKFTNQDLVIFGINIKKNNKIIFSWGRCSIAKGFKELALAWSQIYRELPDYYLVLQMPNNSGESNYFTEVVEILKQTERYIVLDDFNPKIWKTVLRNVNTELVCIPSLMDPFPHTSIEAKLFSKDMNFVTFISDVDGAVDAFTEKESVYVNPRNTKEFSEKILNTLNTNADQRRVIIDKNIETLDKFNFPKILREFIDTNLK